MPRMSLETRQRVVTMRQKGFTVKTVRERLESEGISVSKEGILRLLKKFKLTGSVKDQPRRSRPKAFTIEHYEFIDNTITQNDEITVTQLHELISKKFTDITVSKSTVKKARQDLGWVTTRPRYCQLIRDVNKEKRLLFCQNIKEEEDFENVIWTDECSVQQERHTKRNYRKKGQPKALKPKPKHPLKVHVWGGISCRGATKLVIFSDILVATKLIKIFDASLIPFVESMYQEDHRLLQDNDPKHTSNLARDYLKRRGINWWKTPPESPDLNPIENVWGPMKTYLRDKVKPHNKKTLIEGMQSFWLTLTPEVCKRYILHLKRVVPKVIEEGGGPSGF